VSDGLEPLLDRFRAAFQRDPVAAFREWFRLQEELAEQAEPLTAKALADDLWELLPSVNLAPAQERGRFVHNVAVFFGNPGAAADLGRARACFEEALACFPPPDETGWRARVLHNFASALSNLGQSPKELEESAALFEQALEWRTHERAIARGVTLHNMGIVFRRLAELDPERAGGHLDSSAAAFREAIAIREAHNLAEGHALSLFHLGLTLEAGGKAGEARETFAAAASEFHRLGKSDSANVARTHSQPRDAD
jgi:tetratricopeptide (TPR) repeat protein